VVTDEAVDEVVGAAVTENAVNVVKGIVSNEGSAESAEDALIAEVIAESAGTGREVSVLSARSVPIVESARSVSIVESARSVSIAESARSVPIVESAETGPPDGAAEEGMRLAVSRPRSSSPNARRRSLMNRRSLLCPRPPLARQLRRVLRLVLPLSCPPRPLVSKPAGGRRTPRYTRLVGWLFVWKVFFWP